MTFVLINMCTFFSECQMTLLVLINIFFPEFSGKIVHHFLPVVP